MIKFSLKAGIALGAIYYASEQGLWKDGVETTKLYGKICKITSPYLNDAKKSLPIEVPDLPSSDQMSYLLKNTWNKGVTTSCIFLGNLPDNITKWMSSGLDFVLSNEEIKKFYDSIGSAANQQEPSTK